MAGDGVVASTYKIDKALAEVCHKFTLVPKAIAGGSLLNELGRQKKRRTTKAGMPWAAAAQGKPKVHWANDHWPVKHWQLCSLGGLA